MDNTAKITRFELFGEHCNQVIYGVDLADALMHCGGIKREKKMVEPGKLIPQEALQLVAVLGNETLPNGMTKSRGGHSDVITVVVETTEGHRLAIDARAVGTVE